MWKSEDGKVIEIDGEDGQKKTIRINMNDKDGETMMWKSEDGKVIEIDGEDGEKNYLHKFPRLCLDNVLISTFIALFLFSLFSFTHP